MGQRRGQIRLDLQNMLKQKALGTFRVLFMLNIFEKHAKIKKRDYTEGDFMNIFYQREEYNYDMTKYVELPNYKDYVIEVDYSAIPALIENVKKNIGEKASKYDDEFVEKYFGFSTVVEFEKSWAKSVARKQFYSYLKNNTKIISFPKKEYEAMEQALVESSNEFKTRYNMSFEEYLKKTMDITISEYIQKQMKDKMMVIALADKEGIKPTCEMVEKEKTKYINDISEHYLEEHGFTVEEAMKRATADFEMQGGLHYVYECLLVQLIDSRLIKYNKKST